jgi:hypothetical protein
MNDQRACADLWQWALYLGAERRVDPQAQSEGGANITLHAYYEVVELQLLLFLVCMFLNRE